MDINWTEVQWKKVYSPYNLKFIGLDYILQSHQLDYHNIRLNVIKQLEVLDSDVYFSIHEYGRRIEIRVNDNMRPKLVYENDNIIVKYDKSIVAPIFRNVLNEIYEKYIIYANLINNIISQYRLGKKIIEYESHNTIAYMTIPYTIDVSQEIATSFHNDRCNIVIGNQDFYIFMSIITLSYNTKIRHITFDKKVGLRLYY